MGEGKNMENIKEKIKAIIFDMDGTIISTQGIWERVTLDVLSHYGINSITSDQEKLLSTLQGMDLRLASSLLIDEFGLACSIEELFARKAELAKIYLVNQPIEFIEGFEGFHKKIQKYVIPTSIATNADLNSLKFLSQKLKFDQFFGNNMYCPIDVENRTKPDPALFLHAAKQLGAQPNDCVVFEDSWAGFQAAKAAGMRCVAIKNSHNYNYLNYVDVAIDNYNQAENALITISNRQ
jgi:beta-phosphoglucomutase-like phosphatase (HAD superfamily)